MLRFFRYTEKRKKDIERSLKRGKDKSIIRTRKRVIQAKKTA